MAHFEVVSNTRIHAIVHGEVERILTPRGFASAHDLTWVRDHDAPIRQMFCFAKWKGGVISPRWGVSLDFVPHLAGGRVKWHRTSKSALPDLCVDARDPALDMGYINGEEPIRREHARIVTAAVAFAEQFWALCPTVGKLPDAVAWLRSRLAVGGLGFYNYTQHPLAAAFVAAKTGDADHGRSELDRFLTTHRLSAETDARLRQLLTEACAG
jgi:hypothetical protein